MFYTRIRAWHKKNERMYKVTSIDFEDEFVELAVFMGDDEGESVVANFKEVIIMQEAGLQDDKKFNLFEGDIIKWEDTIFVLRQGCFGDHTTKINGYGWYLEGEQYTFIYLGGGERIGNTFENPVVEK